MREKEFMFRSCLNTVIKPGSSFSELMSVIGLRKNKNKVYAFLESPCYVLNELALRENGFDNCSVEWLRKNAGARSPMTDSADTFWILTGKHKTNAEKLKSAKSRLKLVNINDFGSNIDSLKATVKLNNEVDNRVFNSLQDADIKEFSAASKEDILDIARRIDLNA